MEEGQIINEQQETQGPSNRADLNTPNGLPFDDFKRALGQAANKYTDEQIERMRIICDKIADLVFDSWLNKRNAA